MEEKKDRGTAFERAVEAVLGGEFNDLGVVADDDGVLHVPDKIKRRKEDGTLSEVDIVFKRPTNPQRIIARRRARERMVAEKLDEEKDAHFFDDFENYELLAFAIRDPEPGHVQHVPDGAALAERYEYETLAHLWSKLNLWRQTLDPRFGELDAEECWKIVHRIAALGDARPLGDIAGFEQNTCIVFMAKELLKLQTQKQSTPSPST